MNYFIFIIFVLFTQLQIISFSSCKKILYFQFLSETNEFYGNDPKSITIDKDLNNCTIFIQGGSQNGVPDDEEYYHIVYQVDKDLKFQERIKVPVNDSGIYSTVYGSCVWKHILFFEYMNEGVLYAMYTENGTSYNLYNGTRHANEMEIDDTVCCKNCLYNLAVENGFIYASYSCGWGVFKYNLNGKRLSSIGSTGDEEGQFREPTALVIDEKGYLYVTDSVSKNRNVQKFTLDGEFIKRFGVGKFSSPGARGIAVDNNGYVYVTNANVILVFTDDGKYVRKFRISYQPHCIVYCNGVLYVTDDHTTIKSYKIHYDGIGIIFGVVGGVSVCFLIAVLLVITFFIIIIKIKRRKTELRITDQTKINVDQSNEMFETTLACLEKKKEVDLDYEKIKEIGSGAFGKVYVALLKGKKELIAIKEVEKSSINEKLTIREKELMLKLCHKNILKILGFKEKEEKFIIITEYADGGDLKSFMKKQGDFKSKVKISKVVFKQILEGISYMHSFGVFHRDIKSDNILVWNIDRLLVKIADFGCSKLLDNNSTSGNNTIIGTPANFSPEFLKSEEEVIKVIPEKVDIWAAGITFIECLIGKHPFIDIPKLRGYIKNLKTVEIPSKIKSDYPQLADMIGKCLIVDPEERFYSKNLLNHPFFRDYSKH